MNPQRLPLGGCLLLPLLLPLLLLSTTVLYVAAQQCTGSDDFGVVYNGSTAFTISQSNGTCHCPGGFLGPGDRLTRLGQNSDVANLTATIARLEAKVVNLTATIAAMQSQPAAGGAVVSDSLACTAANPGALRITSQGFLQFCFNSIWRSAAAGGIGLTQSSAAPSCSVLKDNNYTVNGLYWIDPTLSNLPANAVQAYCDFSTFGVAWTRVHTVALGTSCPAMSSSALGDPAQLPACSKYSDSFINLLAPNKMFYSRLIGSAATPLITRYSGTISIGGSPGSVYQTSTSVAQALAGSLTPTQYGSWIFFHQQNWYNTDRCFGAPAGSNRLSQEYIPSTSTKYMCTGACNADCPTQISSGLVEVFIR